MRILLITRYFPPLESVATNRMLSWAKYWGQQGHDVTVCTTDKEGESIVYEPIRVLEVPYFDPITFFGEKQFKRQANSNKGIRSRFAHFLMGWYRWRLNERLPNRTCFWVSQAKKRLKLEEGFDLIISSYGPPSAHLIGLWAKKHFKCPWFADFRDLWVMNHNYLGVWPFTLLERALEKRIVAHADFVITVSEGLKDILQGQYPNLDIRVVPNGFDPENLMGLSRSQQSEKFSLVYTGTLFEGRYNIEPLFKALRKILDNDSSFDTRFELLFYGSASQYLQHMIERYQLSSLVVYHGIVSYSEALQVQVNADAFLQLNFEYEFDGILSGKVYEYLAADKPILALGVSPASELGRLIQKAKGGILCKDHEIMKAVIALVSGQYQHQSDRKVIEQFSRKRHAEVITSWALKCSLRVMSSSE